MNIEGKISEVLYGLSDLCGSANIDPRIDDIVSICQQEIDEACKKQREICAKEYLRDKGYSDTTQSVISTIILNAPSPKER